MPPSARCREPRRTQTHRCGHSIQELDGQAQRQRGAREMMDQQIASLRAQLEPLRKAPKASADCLIEMVTLQVRAGRRQR
jgi:hypothetical protein